MEKVKQIYQCPICGFHYEDEMTAKKCEAWCREHKSCNIQIIKESFESQKVKETI